jgi:putative N-acetyltransferase (TIGR04045 family)
MIFSNPIERKKAEYRIRLATQPWEKQQAYALRRAVFCDEQRIFAGEDIDDADRHAQMIVIVAHIPGQPDQVVGTIRIHEAESRAWWVSRLAVDASFRLRMGLGSALIRTATGVAVRRGCETLHAMAQRRRRQLFARAGWVWIDDRTVYNTPHCLMRADTDIVAPSEPPEWGWALRQLRDEHVNSVD